MDFEFADRCWDVGFVSGMVHGRMTPDTSSVHGWADVPAVSWYQRRCLAFDRGEVSGLLDAIQLERAVLMIPDPHVRGAMMLALMGWDFPEIGAAINDHRTGERLVKVGILQVVKAERRRKELRDKRAEYLRG